MSFKLFSSLVGWSIVPDFATKHLLNFAYSPAIVRILQLTPAPPGSPTYRRHYGITFALVVLGYLLWTLVDKAVHAPPNFYEILGVRNDVDEGGLKAAFRAFARRYHPDRPGVGKEGEELFIHVRDVLEALKDPAVRFAYDRFGPDVLKWKERCKTPGDFLWQGLLSASGYHISGLAFLLFWSVVGRTSSFTFWRYILYFALLSAELALILSPSPSPDSTRHMTILHRLFPNRVVFQHVLFMHQLFMFFNVALFRVTPYLIPVDELADPRVEEALVERTMALIAVADRETSRIIHTELQSIAPHPSSSNTTDSDGTPTSQDPTHVDPGDADKVGFGPKPQHPSFARLEPVTAQTATTLLHEIAPEVEALILETNLKQERGPLTAAWEAAVRRAYERGVEEARKAASAAVQGVGALLSPTQERFGAVSGGGALEEEDEGPVTTTGLTPSLGLSPPHSRETTPTPMPVVLPITPSASSGVGAPVRVKIEPHDDDASNINASPQNARGGGTGYFPSESLPRSMPSTPSAFEKVDSPHTPRSLMKSVPRTPGELPSPRPSPSPPPGTPPLSPGFQLVGPGPGSGGW